MKNLMLSLFFLCSISFTLNACSCEDIPSFCESTKYSIQENYGLIFYGEVIYSEEIADGYFAFEFLIHQKYYGDILLPTDPAALDNGYENTDSTVWVTGGNGLDCIWGLQNGKALMACNYDFNYVGYTPRACQYNYFVVDDNDNFQGYIHDRISYDTVNLSEVQSIIDAECISSTEDLQKPFETSIEIYPNPFKDQIQILVDDNSERKMNFELYDQLGRKIFSVQSKTPKTTIDSNLPKGIYNLVISHDDQRVVKKIVKV